MTFSAGSDARILGLDPSLTGFGVAKLTPGPRYSFDVDTDRWAPKSRGSARLAWFQSQLADVLEEFGPTLVVLEGYAYAKGNSAHQIGELGGVIRLMLYVGGFDYLEVAPAKLKKFVTGKGNAPKEQVVLDAYKRFQLDLPSTDETEAACLAIMGAVARKQLEVNLPVPNMEALASLL